MFARKSAWFTLEGGVIHYYGTVSVERQSHSRAKWENTNDLELLENACLNNPELFRDLPVVMLGDQTRKRHRLTCEDAPSDSP